MENIDNTHTHKGIKGRSAIWLWELLQPSGASGIWLSSVFFYLIVLFYIFINIYQVKSITWQPGRKDFAAIEVDPSILLDSDKVIPVCLPSSSDKVCTAKENCTSWVHIISQRNCRPHIWAKWAGIWSPQCWKLKTRLATRLITLGELSSGHSFFFAFCQQNQLVGNLTYVYSGHQWPGPLRLKSVRRVKQKKTSASGQHFALSKQSPEVSQIFDGSVH